MWHYRYSRTAMQGVKKSLIRVLCDSLALAFLIIFLIIGQALEVNGIVTKRGFYCDDESIRYPYRPDTVPTWALVVGSVGIPLVAVRWTILLEWTACILRVHMCVCVRVCLYECMYLPFISEFHFSFYQLSLVLEFPGLLPFTKCEGKTSSFVYFWSGSASKTHQSSWPVATILKHAHLMPTSCPFHAHLIPISCPPHATSCPPHAHLIPTHAHLTPTHATSAHLMPTSCPQYILCATNYYIMKHLIVYLV